MPGGVCPGGCLPRRVCLPMRVSAQRMSGQVVCRGVVCLGRFLPGDGVSARHPTVNRMIDRQVEKYYPAAVPDGKYHFFYMTLTLTQ